MTLCLDSESYSMRKQENETTINDMATAFFVRDLQRAIGLMGCTPQCIDDVGLWEPMDAAHDFVTAGPCFESSEGDLPDLSMPAKIEVMLEGDNDTVMSTDMQTDEVPSSMYESFADIEQPRNCARTAFLAKCLQPKK